MVFLPVLGPYGSATEVVCLSFAALSEAGAVNRSRHGLWVIRWAGMGPSRNQPRNGDGPPRVERPYPGMSDHLWDYRRGEPHQAHAVVETGTIPKAGPEG